MDQDKLRKRSESVGSRMKINILLIWDTQIQVLILGNKYNYWSKPYETGKKMGAQNI